MRTGDYDQFSKLMQALADGFGKPLTDGLVKVFWEALKDLYIEQFETSVKNHLRYKKFFPKPSELRPAGEKAPEPHDKQFADAAEAQAVKTWEELRQRDPARYWVEFERAYLARLDFRLTPGSPEHKQAADRCRTRCAAELRLLNTPSAAYGAVTDGF